MKSIPFSVMRSMISRQRCYRCSLQSIYHGPATTTTLGQHQFQLQFNLNDYFFRPSPKLASEPRQMRFVFIFAAKLKLQLSFLQINYLFYNNNNNNNKSDGHVNVENRFPRHVFFLISFTFSQEISQNYYHVNLLLLI